MKAAAMALPIPARVQASLPAAMAVAIQALSSLSNLAVTWFLVRRIGVDGFGYFTIYFMVAVNVTSVAAALISQPLYSIGSKLSAKRQREFVQAATFGQNLVNLGLIVVGAAGTLGCYLMRVPVSHALAITALSVAMNFGECWRRSRFFGQKMLHVLNYDLLRYLLLGMAILGAPRVIAHADAAAYAVVMAATYPIAVAALAPWSRPEGPAPAFEYPRAVAQLRRIVRSGSHLAIGTVLRLANAQFPIFVGFFVLGAYETGLIRVGQTIVGLTNPAAQAIEHVVPTALGRRIRRAGFGPAIHHFRKVCAAIIMAFLALYIGVTLVSPVLLRLMGVPAGINAVLVVAGLCVAYLMYLVATLIAIEARAREDTRLVSASLAWSAVLAVIVSYPLVRWFGLAGLIVGMSATQIIGIVFLIAKLKAPQEVVAKGADNITHEEIEQNFL